MNTTKRQKGNDEKLYKSEDEKKQVCCKKVVGKKYVGCDLVTVTLMTICQGRTV